MAEYFTVRRGIWTQNLWLLLAGLALLGPLLALGSSGFEGAIHHYFLQYTFLPGYLKSLLVMLHTALVGTGVLCVIFYVVAGARSVNLLAWLGGDLWKEGSTVEKATVALSLLALAGGLGFVGLRLGRDVLRARLYGSLPVQERRAALASGGPLTPYYDAVREMKAQLAGHEGAVALLRPPLEARQPPVPDEYLLLSYELFPVRVYLAAAPGCDEKNISREWFVERRISWMIPDCGISFEPRLVPLEREEVP